MFAVYSNTVSHIRTLIKFFLQDNRSQREKVINSIHVLMNMVIPSYPWKQILRVNLHYSTE